MGVLRQVAHLAAPRSIRTAASAGPTGYDTQITTQRTHTKAMKRKAQKSESASDIFGPPSQDVTLLGYLKRADSELKKLILRSQYVSHV